MSISLYDNKVHFHTCLSMKFCPISRSALAIRQTKHHEKPRSSLFITSLRTVFGGSEFAITYLCTEHRTTASLIAPFKIECAKHSCIERSIHHRNYDEDVFTCIQSYFSSILNNDFIRCCFMRLPRILLQEIEKKRCLLFVGAGLSINADLPPGMTMPTWSQLAKQLDEQLKQLHEHPSTVEKNRLRLSRFMKKFWDVIT